MIHSRLYGPLMTRTVLQAFAVVTAVWIPPRKPLKENYDHTKEESVGQVSYVPLINH